MGKLRRQLLGLSLLPLAGALAAQGLPVAVAPRPAPPVAVAPNTPLVVPAPPPVVLPPAIWLRSDAEELLRFIQSVGAEGLDPADYDPAGLASALGRGDGGVISLASTDRFLKLASDLALGHVRGGDRQDWHAGDDDLNGHAAELLLRDALARRRVGDALRALQPTHPQFHALKASLAAADPADTALINRIRLNLDRWRWLPRDLGQRYIIVNVPAYTAVLVEDGVARSRHRAVAGAIKTPTPQLSAMATGVILNPWWEVPTSIAREVAGKRGYVAVRGADGKVQRWRQPPGPRNALGKIKFVMPNPQAIYLHDTAAKGLFDSKARAYSHGCIRTEHILDLAAILLAEDGGQWDQARINSALASGKTVKADFVRPLPVYIVYFTAAATVDGKIASYSDIYRRDGKVIAALLDRGAPSAKVAAKE